MHVASGHVASQTIRAAVCDELPKGPFSRLSNSLSDGQIVINHMSNEFNFNQFAV